MPPNARDPGANGRIGKQNPTDPLSLKFSLRAFFSRCALCVNALEFVFESCQKQPRFLRFFGNISRLTILGS
jgi:hypothetical protein